MVQKAAFYSYMSWESISSCCSGKLVIKYSRVLSPRRDYLNDAVTQGWRGPPFFGWQLSCLLAQDCMVPLDEDFGAERRAMWKDYPTVR